MFAGIAVVLAGLRADGNAGLVSQRTREVGVRVLAPRVRTSRGSCCGQGMFIGVAGIVAGCAAAAGVTRYLQGWITEVTALDTLTFVCAGVFMFMAAMIALWLLIRKALRVDPIRALRAD